MTLRGTSEGSGRWVVIGILALFVLLVMPLVIWPLDPQPDERRYSIAAAQMMASGDYLVPLSETGEPRLKKPPLTYYYIVAGFALIGQSLAGAKLFFVLSAAAIVAVVFAIARALGASVVAAVLAAAMMAGHRLFFTTSTQYIPDTPLILGTAVALLGFVHVLRGTARPWHLYLAWLGIGWAVLAKGFLAPILLVLYGIARLLPGAPRLTPQLRRHERIAALLGIALAGWWFVAMGLWHRDDLILQFVGDQVTGKVSVSPASVLAGIAKTTTALVVLALPGLLALGLARHAAGPRPWARPFRDPAIAMLVGWIVVNIVIFAFSRQIFGRYVLPAAPAFMALAALYASTLPPEALATGLRRAMRVLMPVLALAVLAGAVTGILLGAVGWGMAAAALAIVGLVVMWRALARRPLLAGIAGVVLFFPGLELAQLPIDHAVILPSDGQVAAARIAALDPSASVLIVHRHAQLVDRTGVALGDFERLGFATALPAEPDSALVIFLDQDLAAPLQADGYQIEQVPVLRGLNIAPQDIPRLFALPDAAAVRAAFGTPLYFATRP